jgi:hypothetical protein
MVIPSFCINPLVKMDINVNYEICFYTPTIFSLEEPKSSAVGTRIVNNSGPTFTIIGTIF